MGGNNLYGESAFMHLFLCRVFCSWFCFVTNAYLAATLTVFKVLPQLTTLCSNSTIFSYPGHGICCWSHSRGTAPGL